MSVPSFSTKDRTALEWLAGRMIEDLIPDYVDGRFASDPAAEAAIEEILQSNSAARDFHARYTAAIASQTPEQWREDAERSLAGIHACLAALSTAPANLVPHQIRTGSDNPPEGVISRALKWFTGTWDDLSIMPELAYTLRPEADPSRQVWKLALSTIGLSEEERRKRTPWAGGIVQITRALRADGSAAWSAYVEPSGDARPHGVLLVALQQEGNAAREVRLTKNSPKKMFPPAALPEQLDSLRFAVAIE